MPVDTRLRCVAVSLKDPPMYAELHRTAASSVYQCPETEQALVVDTARAVTVDGSKSYPVKGGCIVFLENPGVADEAELSKVKRALERSGEVGWRAAVDEAYVPGTSPHRYITDSGRAAFLELVPLREDAVVLEIGCSMGQHTPEIAARCGHVYGLDVVSEQARFTKEKCRQEGIHNVSVACGGDEGRLPYQSDIFDAVFLNLVFEWCGSRSKEAHWVIQRRLLREISRVTKPGGYLYLNTKNRYSLSLLMGERDEHTNMIRFGSALPRAVLAALLRMRRIDKTPGWLHSYGGLRSMVRAAGYSKIQSYWAAPEMRYPTRFIPTDAASVRRARRSLGRDLGPGRAQRALLRTLPAPLIKHVTPGLCLVAEQ